MIKQSRRWFIGAASAISALGKGIFGYGDSSPDPGTRPITNALRRNQSSPGDADFISPEELMAMCGLDSRKELEIKIVEKDGKIYFFNPTGLD